MERRSSPAQSEDFAMNRLLGGPLIVVDQVDEYITGIESIKHCCQHKNYAIELQGMLNIANQKLAQFHELLETQEALKKHNEELESLIRDKSCIAYKSHITQTKDKSLEKLKHLSLSLDESPFMRIIELERELKDVKLELALTRTREDQLKQQLHQQNVGSHISDPKEKQNKELCFFGPISQELPSANVNKEDYSIIFSRNSRHSSLQSNEHMKENRCNIIKNATLSNMKNITMRILSSIASNSNADTGKHFNAKSA